MSRMIVYRTEVRTYCFAGKGHKLTKREFYFNFTIANRYNLKIRLTNCFVGRRRTTCYGRNMSFRTYGTLFVQSEDSKQHVESKY